MVLWHSCVRRAIRVQQRDANCLWMHEEEKILQIIVMVTEGKMSMVAYIYDTFT